MKTGQWRDLPEMKVPRAHCILYLDKMTHKLYSFFGILGKIAERNNNYSVGKHGLLINFIIYIVAGLRYGLEIMIYSVIYSIVDNTMLDRMHEQNICSTAFIFCKENPKKINDFIKNELIKLERNIKKLNIQTFMVKSEGIGIKGEFQKQF